jgi:hypothetical protein
MDIDAALHALEALPLALSIRESPWIFPTVETAHVFALTVVVGSIGMLDLRLLGLRTCDREVRDLAREILPWTWSFFLLAVFTGSLMFVAKAMTYAHNLPFQIKLVLLALAGGNMLAFHMTTYRSVSSWGVHATPPFPARLAGGLSLLFWISVVVAGRWIGFTT